MEINAFVNRRITSSVEPVYDITTTVPAALLTDLDWNARILAYTSLVRDAVESALRQHDDFDRK